MAENAVTAFWAGVAGGATGAVLTLAIVAGLIVLALRHTLRRFVR
jgi:hypothetical protein